MIRPQKSMVVSFSVVMGISWLIGAGAMLVLGSLSAAHICLGIGGLFIYAVLGWHLWWIRNGWESVGCPRVLPAGEISWHAYKSSSWAAAAVRVRSFAKTGTPLSRCLRTR